jgi:hypothetical protein
MAGSAGTGVLVEVSGQRGQVGAGRGGERVPGSRVKLVLGQPALDERDLEHADHLLAVGGLYLDRALAVDRRVELAILRVSNRGALVIG